MPTQVAPSENVLNHSSHTSPTNIIDHLRGKLNKKFTLEIGVHVYSFPLGWNIFACTLLFL
jgi:hypothetical protein